MWPPTHFTVRELIDRLRSYIISLSIICPVVAGENYYSPAFTDQWTKAQGVWVHLLQSQGHKVSKLGFHTNLYVPTPLSLWMGNEGFLDWHWFTHHNKRTLLWTLLTMDLVRDRGPCSSSGGAHRELGTPEDPGPGVSCSVIPSPCPVLMQTSSLDLSWSLCVVCFQATKGTCLLWALGGKRRGVGCGPGPALLVPFYSGAEFWVVWKIFQLWLK